MTNAALCQSTRCFIVQGRYHLGWRCAWRAIGSIASVLWILSPGAAGTTTTAILRVGGLGAAVLIARLGAIAAIVLSPTVLLSTAVLVGGLGSVTSVRLGSAAAILWTVAAVLLTTAILGSGIRSIASVRLGCAAILLGTVATVLVWSITTILLSAVTILAGWLWTITTILLSTIAVLASWLWSIAAVRVRGMVFMRRLCATSVRFASWSCRLLATTRRIGLSTRGILRLGAAAIPAVSILGLGASVSTISAASLLPSGAAISSFARLAVVIGLVLTDASVWDVDASGRNLGGGAEKFDGALGSDLVDVSNSSKCIKLRSNVGAKVYWFGLAIYALQ